MFQWVSSKNIKNSLRRARSLQMTRGQGHDFLCASCP